MTKKECQKKLEEEFLSRRTSYKDFRRLLDEERLNTDYASLYIQFEILKEIQFLNDKNISRQ